MSTLHALLFFGGIPLLIVMAIALLVMAPSLAKGPRYRPGQDWDAQPEWFGAAPPGNVVPADRQIEAAAVTPRQQATDATGERLSAAEGKAGGASVHW